MLKSKYESLKELLKEVQATRGLDTNIEFITHVQDLIGHSTEGELYELSKEFKQTFYWVYDEAEGIENTLKFFACYSRFSEDLQTQLADAEAGRDKYQHLYKTEKEGRDLDLKELQELRGRHKEALKDLVNKQTEVDELKKEIISLKAQLFDLITK